jgi:hypothetical protein
VDSNRGSSIDMGKMNIDSILNKNPPHAHMVLELDIIGVVRKLVKYALHFYKRKLIN